MQRPDWVTNEPQWITHCCQIRARAEDLVAGRLGVIEGARALSPIEERRREEALRAARSLVERYAWSLEARAALRRQGAQDAEDQESS
jgi:hypothetical protein